MTKRPELDPDVSTAVDRPRRRGLSLLLRFLVTVGLLAVLLWYIDTGRLLGSFRDMSLWLLAGALGLRLIGRVLTALKWKVCLDASGIRLGFWPVLRIVSLSGLFGMMLPSSVGADAVRLVYLKQMRHALTRSTGTVLADRLVGVLVMAGTSAVGVVLMWDYLREGAVGLTLLIVSVMIWLAAGVVLWRGLMLRLSGLTMTAMTRMMDRSSRPVRLAERVLVKAEQVHQSLHELMRNPRVLGQLVLLSVLMLAVRVAIVHLLFIGVGAPVLFRHELAFIPMILLLTLLPISLFGLGVGEGAFVYFFRIVGVAPATALAVSLMNQAVNVAIMVFGGIPFLLVGHKARPPTAAAVVDADSAKPTSS